VSRGALKWDAALINKQLLMYLNTAYQIGVTGWYLGTIIAYDPVSECHEIEWDDGDKNRKTNLLACKFCNEWRLVEEGEDVAAELLRLNGKDEE